MRRLFEWLNDMVIEHTVSMFFIITIVLTGIAMLLYYTLAR